ncbi:unnamed protein product [Ilex paraguariensis]|uniref:Uncharacterized protein n=1 Tax=Ilex paraguariensis TaxID=185542 RepID=A0ABC8U2F7_9AQUA
MDPLSTRRATLDVINGSEVNANEICPTLDVSKAINQCYGSGQPQEMNPHHLVKEASKTMGKLANYKNKGKAILHTMIVVEPVMQNGVVEEDAMHIGEAIANPISQESKEMASTNTLPNPGNERQSIE